MNIVFDSNLLPIAIAIVVGFLIGFWIFRRNRVRPTSRLDQNASTTQEPPRRTFEPVATAGRSRPIRDGIDTIEGRGIADEGAAAFKDVAGQVLGVDAHPDMPGAGGPPDNLQMLKGVGPKLAQKLNEHGIFRYEQIARLSVNEVAILDEKMGAFRGRLERDRVVEQASYLARGDRDGFEARFGKLGGSA